MRQMDYGTLLFLPETIGVLEPGLYELGSDLKREQEKVRLFHDDGVVVLKVEYLEHFLPANDPKDWTDLC